MGFTVTANIGRSMQSYVDDFHIGHAAGIIGEIGFQNPIDAAVFDFISNVKVNVFVHRENRILKIRDRGTKGLDHCPECSWGLIENEETGETEPCENYSDCRWSSFFSLSQQSKKSGELGSRGQGKSLPALAGSNGLIVRTKIVTEGGKHKSMAAYFRPKKGDIGSWEWDLLPDEAWGPTEDPGTEIEVSSLKMELVKEFSDPQTLVNEYILPHWFPSIDKGMEMTLNITGNKKITVDKSMTDRFFPEVSEEKQKQIPSLQIKVGRSVKGKITDLKLFLADKELPECLRGIALIKGKRQVVDRVTNFGYIDNSLQHRIFGSVQTGRLLDTAEKPNHLGYNDSDLIVKKTFEQIRTCAKDFLEPFQKKLQSGKVTEKDVQKANAIKTAVNSALVDNPEFNPWFDGDEPGPDPSSENPGENCTKCGKKSCICNKSSPKIKKNPWISSIKFNPSLQNFSGGYEVGEDIIGQITISNPVDAEPPNLSLYWAAGNLSHEKVEDGEITIQEFGIIPRPKSQEKPGKIVHEFTFNVHTGEGAFRRGKNLFVVQLRGESMGGELEQFDSLRKSFWVGEKPPPPKRGSSGSSIIEEITPMQSPSEGKDVYLDISSKQVYAFTTNGPNLSPFWGHRQKHPVAVRNLFQALGDEIMKHIVTKKLAELNGELNSAKITGDSGVLEEVLNLKRKFIASAEKAYYP